MGNGVGVHKETEVAHLNHEQRQELKAEVIKELRNIKGIKQPTEQELQSFIDNNSDIREQVKKAVKPIYDRYQK